MQPLCRELVETRTQLTPQQVHTTPGCVLAHYLRMLQPQVGLINHSISPLMSLRLPAAQIYFVALLTTLLISPALFFHHLNIDSVISNMTKTITHHHGKDITTLTFYSLLPPHKVVSASTYSRGSSTTITTSLSFK